MREMNVAWAFICEVDKYHFHRRVGPEFNGAIGKVACVGGEIKKGETADEAVSREFGEETNLQYAPESFHFLFPVEVISDRDDEEVSIKAKVFKLLLPAGTDVQMKHGEHVVYEVDKLKTHLDEMTPGTRASVEELF